MCVCNMNENMLAASECIRVSLCWKEPMVYSKEMSFLKRSEIAKTHIQYKPTVTPFICETLKPTSYDQTSYAHTYATIPHSVRILTHDSFETFGKSNGLLVIIIIFRLLMHSYIFTCTTYSCSTWYAVPVYVCARTCVRTVFGWHWVHACVYVHKTTYVVLFNFFSRPQ